MSYPTADATSTLALNVTAGSGSNLNFRASLVSDTLDLDPSNNGPFTTTTVTR